MPIQVACSGCGKKLTVRDELVGKRIKCPACGTTFEASPGAATPGGMSVHGAPRQRAATKEKEGIGAKLHVSKSIIVLVALAIIIPTIIAIYTYGPYKVRTQWEAMEPTAQDSVKDVVTRAIQSHLSKTGEYDPTKSHRTPHAMNVAFVFGPMYMSMPDEVGFAGSSTEGAFVGSYFPKTGEIQAKVEIGGAGLQGVGAIKRGDETLNVTGRVKDGHIFAEIDGKEATIRQPPPRPE
jgi:hypothetical protein